MSHLPAESPAFETDIHTIPKRGSDNDTFVDINEKKLDVDGRSTPDDVYTPPEEWIARFVDSYSGEHTGETLPPGTDPERCAIAIFTRNEHDSVKWLKDFLEEMRTDYTLDVKFAQYIRDLVLGHEHCGMDYANWAYEVSRVAGTCDNWSPYAEVRAVLLPYDDVDMPCETLRAYILGTFWVTVATLVNTFFFPRQPSIGIPGQVVQLLLVPMGRFMAYALPDWGFTMFGRRYTINPGPWSSKEQLMSTLMFNGASTIGNSTGLLALRAPMFFNQKWVGFGWSVLFALANQGFGLGFAGILRRLTVYPVGAVWPNTLPTLALNRTLINQENKRERIFGWKLTRWHMFIVSSIVFLIYYWIPNVFFQAIRVFNWMTWIAPKNFNLAIITGGYGGMGFNPISTLDPNTGGASGTMNSPFFAQLQQYVLRAISGIIIIIMYYTNTSFSAYMPINSNNTFDNKMQSYNLTRVLNPDQSINEQAYLDYSPPYYSMAYLYTQGAGMCYFTFSIIYVFIRYRALLKKAIFGIFTNFRHGRSIYTGYDDGHCRLMRKYPEVPEWWYGIILILGFLISVVALAAFPTETPWWTVLMVFALGVIMTITFVTIDSIANTGINQQTVWNVLPGLWFPGQFLPLVMLTMLGDAFGAMASQFGNDLKFGHYARIPPRCIFRSHVFSIVLNLVVYCGTLELLESLYNADGTFCSQDNKNFMVCNGPRGYYSGIIAFGTFGTLNLFKLYPALPWCFLLGAILGLMWVGAESYAPIIRRRLTAGMDAEEKTAFEAKYWTPASTLISTIHPAIALSGATAWAGNQNLTYATLGIMSAWFFQFFLKRKYTAWWGKYSFMLFAGLQFGGTISGFIGTLVFSFGAGQGKSFNWGGNTIAHDGVDWELYLNTASLLPLPEQGYFGLNPDQYPKNA